MRGRSGERVVAGGVGRAAAAAVVVCAAAPLRAANAAARWRATGSCIVIQPATINLFPSRSTHPLNFIAFSSCVCVMRVSLSPRPPPSPHPTRRAVVAVVHRRCAAACVRGRNGGARRIPAPHAGLCARLGGNHQARYGACAAACRLGWRFAVWRRRVVVRRGNECG